MSIDPVSVSGIIPAKLNLGLAIVGRREDGFHELVTIMQTITLCDRLTLTQRPGAATGIQVALVDVSSGANGVSVDDPGLNTNDNVAVRAVSTTLDRLEAKGTFQVALEKGIPAASGMGGASADAAAAILAAERLVRLAMDAVGLRRRPLPRPLAGSPARSPALAASAPQAPGDGNSGLVQGLAIDPEGSYAGRSLGDHARLQIAAGLGSDVPFFLTGGTALVTGRGECVEALPPVSPTSFIVVFPRLTTPIPLKTARLFAALESRDFNDGREVREQAARITAGLPLDQALLGNGFVRALTGLAPELIDLGELITTVTGRSVALSGAGPTHYVVEPDPERAEAIAVALRDRLGERAIVFVCRPWDGPPLIQSVPEGPT